MAITQAMWPHGHSMRVEYPDRLNSVWREGFGIRVIGKPSTTNWFHFAILTPVIVNNIRLNIDSALIRFRSNFKKAVITNVHVFDGEKRIAAHDGLNLAPTAWNMHRFGVPGKPDVLWGLGVTLGVAFRGTTDAENTIELSAAGCDLIP